jgi:hypothetical protein
MHSGEDPMVRLDFLYQLGIKMNMNRKDKKKLDIEHEKEVKECVFHPVVDQ